MDPISHSLLGASVCQFALRNKAKIRQNSVLAMLGAMAPDLDIFIRSSSDPLFMLKMHRGFTHSLLFVPFGAAIIAFLLMLIMRRFQNVNFKTIYWPVFAGYATHGLLDVCTSYGTMYFWPFSDERLEWNIISIVDPIFTLFLLTSVIFALAIKSYKPAIIASIFAFFYLGFGVYQHQFMINMAYYLHPNAVRVRVDNSLGNMVLWRVLVLDNKNNIHAFAINKIPFKTEIIHHGETKKLYVPEIDTPYIDSNSLLYSDIKWFSYFADGFVTYDKENNYLEDARYSALPNMLMPMWALNLDSPQDKHPYMVQMQTERFKYFPIFWQMIIRGNNFTPLFYE